MHSGLFGTAGAAEQSVNLSISNRNKVQLQAVPGGRVCDQRSAHSAGVQPAANAPRRIRAAQGRMLKGSITEGGIGRVQRVRCNVIDWAGFRGCGHWRKSVVGTRQVSVRRRAVIPQPGSPLLLLVRVVQTRTLDRAQIKGREGRGGSWVRWVARAVTVCDRLLLRNKPAAPPLLPAYRQTGQL